MNKNLFTAIAASSLLALTGCGEDYAPGNVVTEDQSMVNDVQYTLDALEQVPANNYTIVDSIDRGALSLSIPVENVRGCFQAASELSETYIYPLKDHTGICFDENAKPVARMSVSGGNVRVSGLNNNG